MFHTTRIHIAQRLAVVVAGAALLVPSASAMPFITDTLAPGGTSASSPHIITDTLAPGGGISEVHRWFVIEHASPAAEPKGYRFITDTLAPGGGASGIIAAGIGAVVACGLMLLALIGRQLGGRRRRGQLAF
jgi:hypothetical protein